MQDTRQQILEILKRLGEVTVQELSRELGLTSVTVRSNLGRPCTLRYSDTVQEVETEAGTTYTFDGALRPL